MWWIPPSVANAALWGPTSTLLTWAHLRNSLGNGTVSSGCAHRKRLTPKTADPSSTIKAFFILRLLHEAVSALRDFGGKLILTRRVNPVTNWTEELDRGSSESRSKLRLGSDFLAGRELVEAESDRQADKDHVHQKTLDKAAKLVGAG